MLTEQALPPHPYLPNHMPTDLPYSEDADIEPLGCGCTGEECDGCTVSSA